MHRYGQQNVPTQTLFRRAHDPVCRGSEQPVLEEDGPGQAEDLLGGWDAVEGVDVAVLGRVLVLLALETVAADHVTLRRRLKVGHLLSLCERINKSHILSNPILSNME